MGGWNGMVYDGKDTMLRVVRDEADQMFAMLEAPQVWERSTGAGFWQVRDIVGHLIDTTEEYFRGFDAARSSTAMPEAYGLPGMAERVDREAEALSRNLPRQELLDRLRADYHKMMEIFDALGPDDWGGLTVAHYYMGPLPAMFYPAFQLMDYGVHSWDIRQGTGRAHGLSGEAADLLVPYMFILWQATIAEKKLEPCEIGIRVTSGPNAGETIVRVQPDGMTYEAGDTSGLESVLEFDPGSFVLAAFGRGNVGTIRGDRTIADRYLNLFFRI